MKQATVEIVTLEADEGKMLTNGEIYSSQVYLGVNDSPENWREINEEDVPDEETD